MLSVIFGFMIITGDPFTVREKVRNSICLQVYLMSRADSIRYLFPFPMK